jgi:hypothetical protein
MKAETTLPVRRSKPSDPVVLAALSTEELRAELSRSLEVTAAQLVHLAAIVAELERRGENLSDLRLGLLGYLRRINAGQVLPELVVRFQGRPAALQTASLLPIGDQQRLVASEPLELVVPGSSGQTWDTRLVDPLWLDTHQFRQLAGPAGLRSVPEQIVLLEGRGRPTEGPGKPRSVGRVKPDRKRGGLVVGRTFVPTADVVGALAELQNESPFEAMPRDDKLTIALSGTEKQKLHIAAVKAGVSMTILARRALIAYGLLDTTTES